VITGVPAGMTQAEVEANYQKSQGGQGGGDTEQPGYVSRLTGQLGIPPLPHSWSEAGREALGMVKSIAMPPMVPNTINLISAAGTAAGNIRRGQPVLPNVEQFGKEAGRDIVGSIPIVGPAILTGAEDIRNRNWPGLAGTGTGLGIQGLMTLGGVKSPELAEMPLTSPGAVRAAGRIGGGLAGGAAGSVPLLMGGTGGEWGGLGGLGGVLIGEKFGRGIAADLIKSAEERAVQDVIEGKRTPESLPARLKPKLAQVMGAGERIKKLQAPGLTPEAEAQEARAKAYRERSGFLKVQPGKDVPEPAVEGPTAAARAQAAEAASQARARAAQARTVETPEEAVAKRYAATRAGMPSVGPPKPPVEVSEGPVSLEAQKQYAERPKSFVAPGGRPIGMPQVTPEREFGSHIILPGESVDPLRTQSAGSAAQATEFDLQRLAKAGDQSAAAELTRRRLLREGQPRSYANVPLPKK